MLKDFGCVTRGFMLVLLLVEFATLEFATNMLNSLPQLIHSFNFSLKHKTTSNISNLYFQLRDCRF